ncbi:hypothetical protein HAX54_019694 [Datura stramonium]|uniref:Uncharacterized protein n=1 Tax=Datura stramonium TaxID=4076 RepID=A0ABS8URA5_DATST|nr:hypothetical protein [Datura stramonium]
MKHAKFLSLSPMTTKWYFLILCVTFSLVNSQDTNTMAPAAGLLCISECATCPVICSPPPSPIKLKPPPTPLSSLLQTPPPPPPLFAPLRPSPPQSSSHSPSPSSSHKSPPPSYMIYTGAPPPPPPHPSNCPTPPNPPNIINTIPATQVPPVVGQKNYTYPYYYYFASEAASLPLHGSIVLGFWVVFHFICI